MKRKYKLNPFKFSIGPNQVLELAKEQYKQKFPNEINPFPYCIVYLVINKDKTLNLTFNYEKDVGLKLNFIHKRPKGGRIGEAILNIDIREITNINIPKYQNKYYFDFVFFLLDITTNKYWCTNLWTQKVCPDLRYYLSAERKQQYIKIGKQLADKYNTTMVLGHVNLITSKLKKSSGISRLCSNGWIPTISLFPQPYGEMVNRIEKNNDMNDVNSFISEAFEKNNIIDKMLERWEMASLTKSYIEILGIGLKNFLDKNYISTVYTILPQIEGLITYHIKRKNQHPKERLDERFKQFGDIIKSEKFNTTMTKYLTDFFIRNLKKTFFKTWFPFPKQRKKYSGSNISPQRHILLHGGVKKAYFTEENCIKLICIIDNIILLSLRKTELKK
jgi:hypothetical protein